VAHNTWTDPEFKPNSALLLLWRGVDKEACSISHEYKGGQLALKAAGLFEEFLGLIQAEAEAQSVLEENSSPSE
jgi:hypothetical protein